MSRIQSSTNTNATKTGQSTDLRDVDMNQFLTLMITELQNQDPLNPMDNSQMLQQLSTIRQIGSTNQLTESLQAVLLGQNVSTASNLIGKKVTALDNDNKNVDGVVERVSISVDSRDESKRTVSVHLTGGKTVELDRVREILNP